MVRIIFFVRWAMIDKDTMARENCIEVINTELKTISAINTYSLSQFDG